MRHALGVLGVLAAGVLLAVSAAMNWQFGYSLGRNPFDGQLYGAASAAADCMKALVPFYFFAAWRNRMWSQAVASALVWSVVTAYSLTSALGNAAHSRTDTSSARSASSQAYLDARADRKRAQDELSWIPAHRPAASVQADIGGVKGQRAWEWSNGCTKLDGKAERQLCDKYHALQAELASGQKAEVLEKRIADADGKLSAQANSQAGASEADPQAAVLTALLGKIYPDVKMTDVQTMMSVFVALLLEVGSGLGMYVAFSQWRLHDVKAPSAPRIVPVVQASATTINTAAAAVAAQPAVQQQLPKPRSGANDNKSAPAITTVTRMVAPETDVERFYKESIDVTDGSSLTATELYEDYCAWCETKTKEPLALPTFGRSFGELGVKKEKIAGRIRYIGIALKSGQEHQEDKKPPVFASQAA
jgi:hypothetical protein